MPDETIDPILRRHVIADRIGPILDPAFLKLVPVDKLRDIVLVQLRVQTESIKGELKAVEEVTKIVQEVRVR